MQERSEDTSVDDTITAAELQKWRDKHQLTLKTGAQALGVTRRHFAGLLSGERPIVGSVALLVIILDDILTAKQRQDYYAMLDIEGAT